MAGRWYVIACPRPLKMPDGVTGSIRRQQLFVAGWPMAPVDGVTDHDVVWVGTTESDVRTEKFANHLGESWQDWNEVCSLNEFSVSTQPELVSFRLAIQSTIGAVFAGKGHPLVRLSAAPRDQKSA